MTVLRLSIIGDEDAMPSLVKSPLANMIAAINAMAPASVRIDEVTFEDRRALRRLRNDKLARRWSRSDNKRVEAAMANRY